MYIHVYIYIHIYTYISTYIVGIFSYPHKGVKGGGGLNFCKMATSNFPIKREGLVK